MSDMSAVKVQAQLEQERRKVDVDHFDISVRELVRMAEENELKRAPAYQRKFRWPESSESKLIESLLLGLPIPSLYVATNKDGTWEVVDGLQRISTVLHFCAAESVTDHAARLLTEIRKSTRLVLNELEILTQLNGKNIDDFPTAMKLNFLRRPLRLTALSDKSDYDVRFQTFERLNTGGVALSPQEVRSCVFRGAFNDFLAKLAGSEDFVTLVKLQEKSKSDGTREELVLKFFAYLYNRSSFKGAVAQFLNGYMKNIGGREDFTSDFNYEENERLFNEVVQHVLRACGNGPFLRAGYHTTPLNQLEAVLVGVGEVIMKAQQVQLPGKGWQNDEILVDASTKGTNTRAALTARIERARELFSPSDGPAPRRSVAGRRKKKSRR